LGIRSAFTPVVIKLEKEEEKSETLEISKHHLGFGFVLLSRDGSAIRKKQRF
jgi:hypothetical protein